MNALAIAQSPVLTDEVSLVRRFTSWTAGAFPHERAEAVNALARAYLHCEWPPEARAHAEIALTRALDDPELGVRRALAEAFASARQAPRPIVLALCHDISEVSRAPLAHSPLLGDADLVDCVGFGDAIAQTAIARRAALSPAVAAALAEIGERGAVLALIGNVGVALAKAALWRVFERFEGDPVVRERLAERPKLPAALRAAVAAATAADLSYVAVRRHGGAPRRAERIARDGSEQAFVAIAADCADDERAELVVWLRGAGRLTVGLLVRGLACGDVALFTAAIADMAQLPPARVAGWLRDPRGASFAALYGRAKLPPHLLPAFRIALECAFEHGGVATVGVDHVLTMKMLHAVEARGEAALASVVAMLWRLVSEGARAEAREFVDVPVTLQPSFEEAPLEIVAAAPPVLMLNVEASNENYAPLVELDLPEAELVVAA